MFISIIQLGTKMMTLEGLSLAVGFLNGLGIFLLLYKAGRYTGTTDTRIDKLEECTVKSVHDNEKISEQLTRHGESLARLETDSNNMKMDIRSVRDRQHELANSLAKIPLKEMTN